MTSKWKKVKYVSNHWSDLTEILKLGTQLIYKSFKWQWLKMKDDLKILRVEYLSNNLLDQTQNLHEKIIFYKSFKRRQPQIEDDLQILKVDYPSNHLLDHTHILNLSLNKQIIFYKSLNEDDLHWKTTFKY